MYVFSNIFNRVVDEARILCRKVNAVSLFSQESSRMHGHADSVPS